MRRAGGGHEDAKTLKVTKHIPLTNHPNNVSVSKDGKRVYVAIVAGAGAVDVIDTTTLTRVKSIRTEGGIHNTYVTPDGKFVVAGSITLIFFPIIEPARTNLPSGVT